ncbi:MAG TPA: ATP-binding protein [Oculatellaceae cyanobacterium]
MNQGNDSTRSSSERSPKWLPASLLPKLSHQALILLAIPLLFQVIFVTVLSIQINQAEEEAWQELRAKNIITEASELMRLCQNAGLGLYKSWLGTDMKFSDQYASNANQMRKEIYLLRVLVGTNAEQRQVVDKTEDALKQVWQLALSFEARSERGEDVSHGVMLSQFRARMLRVTKNLFNVVSQLNDLAAKSRQDPLKSAQSRLRVQYLLLGGLAVDILMAAALALVFNRLTNSRLATLLDNTRRLASGESLIPALAGRDELAELDGRFHEMAAALLEAQRKERAVVQNAVDVICSLDSELRFSRVNPAAVEMFGRQTDDLIGTHVAEHILSEDIKPCQDALTDARTTGSVKTFEGRILRAGGSVADALWSVQWSANEQSYFCVLHDVTARKEVERMKEEFIQMISHDLRTPLMSVQTDLNLLEAGVVDPVTEKIQKRLAGADKNVSYVIELINSLLDIERLNAGELQLELSDFPINDVLVRAVDTVKPLAERGKVRVEFALSDSTLRVRADERRVLQVSINLLSNAVKFSPKDSTITVSVTRADKFCKVAVTDQGRGIPKEALDKIFDRFRQVEQSDASIKGGSGLGLAICKAIVNEHGGELTVRSEVGKGSTFEFTVPLIGDEP